MVSIDVIVPSDSSSDFRTVEALSSPSQADGVVVLNETSYRKLLSGPIERVAVQTVIRLGDDLSSRALAARVSARFKTAKLLTNASQISAYLLNRQLDDLSSAALRVMNASLNEKLSIDCIAKSCCVSRSTLEKHLSTALQLSPKQALIVCRMNEAARLLIESSYSIATIAMHTGYEDHSAFARQFFRSTGVTPREYREIYERPSTLNWKGA
jgi:transcriptional regulator GlxA family with amidase domain